LEHFDQTKEIILLRKEIKELRNDLTVFLKSTETFQNIMGTQTTMFDKAGLGFDLFKNQKIYENFFIPAQKENIIRCSYCNKNGHLESICYNKKRVEHSPHKPKAFHQVEKKLKQCSYCSKIGHFEKDCFFKNILVKKTNPKGPNSKWVPKIPLTQNAGLLSKCKEKALVFGQWLFKAYDRR
jgi:uncharacterized Zn-finger protein